MKKGVRKKLALLAALLAMLPAATATVVLAQTEPGDEEVRCLIPEGCGPLIEDELLCLLPEGCNTNGDGVPDFEAGEPVPNEEAGRTGTIQYGTTL